ncbi:ATP-binding protein [Streptomyces sp. NPDC093510]|uniref:ATP-binding protein n=1 Tax=Streptomyces sp. NPDC093510 TaxID=3155199 RepID=UPI003429F667
MNLDRWITRTTSHARAQPAAPHVLLLRGRPQAPTDARHFVRDYLAADAPEVTGAYLDDVVLIVSELVTNAVRHGSTPGAFLRLMVDADDHRTRIEVHDPSQRHPHVHSATSQEDHGRGLAIVDILCPASWGVTDTAGGKAVWAEVKAP